MSKKITGFYDIHIENQFVKQNDFIRQINSNEPLPTIQDFLKRLPKLFIPDMPIAEACYDYAWKTAFKSLKSGKNVFPNAYIDTCFNGHLFMWDSAFIMQFAKYGIRAFPFLGTLDNLYSKQHPDGFICREIDEEEGFERFERFDLSSTGPNVFAWVEWSVYLLTQDLNRLKKVFPVILAYHLWLRSNRTWKDGSYYTSGWGSGMDNLPRQTDGTTPEFSHGHLSWVDMTAQQALSAKMLLNMAEVLSLDDCEGLRNEYSILSKRVQEMWDPKCKFFCDWDRDGISTGVMTVGGYWVMLAGLATPEQAQEMVNHLFNPETFSSKMVVGGLSQNHVLCDDNYWRGGVWAPTTYMVFRALEQYGFHKERRLLAKNYLNNIYQDYQETGILYEVYESKTGKHQSIAREHFVGWTGLAPISVMLEDFLGIRIDYVNRTVTLHLDQNTPSFTIEYLPYGEDLLSIHYQKDTPEILEKRVSILSHSHGKLVIIYEEESMHTTF